MVNIPTFEILFLPFPTLGRKVFLPIPTKFLLSKPDERANLMAKISVSIPDESKEQLDAYAAETGFKRSEAVAHILELFFAGEIAESDPEAPEPLDALADQLRQVVEYLDGLRSAHPEIFFEPEWSKEKPKRISFIRRS